MTGFALSATVTAGSVAVRSRNVATILARSNYNQQDTVLSPPLESQNE